MMSNSDSENTNAQYPTTTIEHADPSGIPTYADTGPSSYQKRLVGNVREGQVLVNVEAVRAEDYDPEQSHFDTYADKRWTIAGISADRRHLTLRKIQPEDADREPEKRHLSVAEFARETIRSERWMFLKDSYLANTWLDNTHGSVECENCGVNRDNGLSREEHYTTTVDGVEYDVTLRRCVGCGMFGNYARNDAGRGGTHFTTGVLEGPRAPWDADN